MGDRVGFVQRSRCASASVNCGASAPWSTWTSIGFVDDAASERRRRARPRAGSVRSRPRACPERPRQRRPPTALMDGSVGIDVGVALERRGHRRRSRGDRSGSVGATFRVENERRDPAERPHEDVVVVAHLHDGVDGGRLVHARDRALRPSCRSVACGVTMCTAMLRAASACRLTSAASSSWRVAADAVARRACTLRATWPPWPRTSRPHAREQQHHDGHGRRP